MVTRIYVLNSKFSHSQIERRDKREKHNFIALAAEPFNSQIYFVTSVKLNAK